MSTPRFTTIEQLTEHVAARRHGWLAPKLVETPRWEHWFKLMTAGEVIPEKIPMVVWSNPTTPALSMLHKCLNSITRYGGWQGWGSFDYFNFFMDWLLYSFGHAGQRELPKEPDGCEGCIDRLVATFDLKLMLDHPYDYFGDILAENHHGRHLGFYPTPLCLSHMMAMMTMQDDPDARVKTVMDCCVGTGRMLLAASNFSYRLYGSDINPTVLKATLVNGYLYAPWLVRPLPFLDGQNLQRDYSEEISDVIAAQGSGHNPDAQRYLSGTEHDTANGWKFEPLKKRVKTNEEQGVLL